jgi:hypothetical protein
MVDDESVAPAEPLPQCHMHGIFKIGISDVSLPTHPSRRSLGLSSLPPPLPGKIPTTIVVRKHASSKIPSFHSGPRIGKQTSLVQVTPSGLISSYRKYREEPKRHATVHPVQCKHPSPALEISLVQLKSTFNSVIEIERDREPALRKSALGERSSCVRSKWA